MSNGISQEDLAAIRIWLLGVNEITTRLMKELEQFSALLPARGKKKLDEVSRAQIDRILTARLGKIINRH